MNRNRLIFIVEDEKDLAAMMRMRLEAEGFRVETASDGSVALSKIKEISPDLILLDVNLPGMSGIEFYKQISDEHGNTKYPILMLTARDELKDFFKELKVDGFMSKPFNYHDLLALINKILSVHTKPVVYVFDSETNKTIRELKRRMEQEHHEVIITQDISTFKEKLKENMPEVIFVEYMQKGMSGDMVIKMIKQTLRIQLRKKEDDPLGVSIIVYTFSEGNYARKSLEAGATWYMGKPTSYMDFIKVVRTRKKGKT